MIYTVFSFYEIITGYHLPTSDLMDAPRWMRHVPTVVYFNSNDFAFVFTLMMMYVLSVFDTKKSFSILMVIAIFLIHMFIIYKSESRLSFIMSFSFFVYRYPKKVIYSSLFGFVLFFVCGYFLESSWHMQVMDDLANLKSDLSFNERQSTLVRLTLYKYAIFSIISSYGFGYGIDYSAQYYQSINDANLHYIVDPHSFIFELLINSGLLSLLFYIGLNIYLCIKNWSYKNQDVVIQIIIFNLLLFSSSSSLFIWPVYLFLIIYICKTAQIDN
ncbi:MAG: O-antigen ligase family protein [Flavobacteriales bacterium]